MALMAYNGGFANKYLKHIQREEESVPIKILGVYNVNANDTLEAIGEKFKTSTILLRRANPSIKDPRKDLKKGSRIMIPQERKISMQGFNSWLEKEINAKIKAELRSSSYTIRRGDDLPKIAEKFGMDIQLLRSLNKGISTKNLKAGKSLYIPSHYKKRSSVLLDVLSGYRENINYPEKFYAILKTIKKQGLDPEVQNVAVRQEPAKIYHCRGLSATLARHRRKLLKIFADQG